MATAHMLKGHVDEQGTLVLDEPAPLMPGPVLVTVQPVEMPLVAEDGYTDEELAEFLDRIDAIAAIPAPAPPDDGLSAKDYKHILYGPQNGPNDVL